MDDELSMRSLLVDNNLFFFKCISKSYPRLCERFRGLKDQNSYVSEFLNICNSLINIDITEKEKKINPHVGKVKKGSKK